MYILKEFLDAECGNWNGASTRPEKVGAYRIRKAGTTDPVYWSYWDGKLWGRAYADETEILSAESGGSTINQDREWQGLIEEPLPLLPVDGRIVVLSEIDSVLKRGAVIYNLSLRGDTWHGKTDTTFGSSVPVRINKKDTTPAFMGAVPDIDVQYPIAVNAVEEDDGEL